MRSLAGAERLAVGPLDQLDLHLRHLAEAKDRIRRPCVAGDAFLVKANPLLQHPAGGLDRAAFDLIDHTIGVDGFSDIDRDSQPLDADIISTLDLGDNSAIGAGVLVSRKTDAVTDAGTFVRFPVRALRNRADDILRPRIP